ncbi:hypothetical protein JHW43_007065 [Diplocarpon mali]|nr:hypothetical protein JHW43_007065 [Diplocarpon mali]
MALQARKPPVEPISFAPSQAWEGNDGPWSTFAIRVGTPEQIFRVLVSTSSQETWVPVPEGCTSSDPADCGALRGVLAFQNQPSSGFQVNESSTWLPENLYELGIGSMLNYTGNGEYGFDTVGLQLPQSGGATLKRQIVAGIATKDFILGEFGIGPKPTNFTSFQDPQPSFMWSLRNQSMIPSISWGYTAGARYQLKNVAGSLTLGGYDASRFVPNGVTFAFNQDDSRPLTIGVQAIQAKDTFLGTVSLLPSGILSLIDSTVPEIWLPATACTVFESAFGLQYDAHTDRYLVNTSTHASLTSLNPVLSFKLGNLAEGGETVVISLPYKAFDLQVSWPIYANSTNYFPLRRAANDSQYTLGRTFLQEAYVIADYERFNFSVSQCLFQENNPQKLVGILPPVKKKLHSSKLKRGTLIGIILTSDISSLTTPSQIFHGSVSMSFGGQTPTIIVLKEGTDSSQGKGQIISNINACLAVQATIRSTLGPYGGDLLLVDGNGRQTITNDGATVMKLLEIVHPAARILTDIARSQDAEVGDGTTSVVVLAGEVLKEVKEHVEQGVSSQTIIKGLRRASAMAVNKVREIAVNTSEGNQRETLVKLAGTAMSSKLIKRNTGFFTKMVVDAVLSLDQDDLNEKLIGVKKIPGGSLTDSLFVNGVAFKKTFSYAGFEQQPKSFKNPKIVCLNVELELKSEKDNAEVRVEQVSEYQAIVDAEWQIIYNKMEALYKTGAKVVLSKLPIGDLATQYFADRDIFCAGRVASDDLERIIQATGGSIQSTCSDIHPEHLGTCGSFEERQIGGERFNFFEDCPEAKTCTLVLRGGAEQFIAEVERSLHDAIMIVKRAIKNNTIVAGGGACEMEVSAYLHRYADKNVPHKQQAIIKSFAKALEVIPRQLCDNAGFDATDILNKLRVEHRKGNTWSGVDFDNEGVRDNLEAFVWEPALVKINAMQAATEASCLILSVDETIKNEESAQPQAPQRGLPPGAAQRALRGRGRGMPRR